MQPKEILKWLHLWISAWAHDGQPSHVSQSLHSHIPSFNLSMRWRSDMLPRPFRQQECRQIIETYEEEAYFRSTIKMPDFGSESASTSTISHLFRRFWNNRYALVMAVQCGLIRSRNTRLKEFYDRKRAEGKPHKVALVACANKLVHWLYAILISKKSFRPA
jgi:hypothetical protein